jgi:hypothetical protein
MTNAKLKALLYYNLKEEMAGNVAWWKIHMDVQAVRDLGITKADIDTLANELQVMEDADA